MSKFYAISFRNETWVLKRQNSETNIVVFVFDKNQRRFVLARENQLNLNTDGHNTKILDFSCIVEESSGLKQPCILVEEISDTKKPSTIHFYILVNDRTPRKVSSFSHASQLSSTSFILSDGPSLSWVWKDEVHILRSTQSRNLKHSSFLYPNVESLILMWYDFGKNRLVTIARTSTGNIIVIDADDGIIPSDMFVPSIYLSIVSCLCVHEETILSSVHVVYVPQRIKVFYIGTTKGQLLKFAEGKVVAHWQLPFENPCIIDIIKSGSRDICAVIQSKEKMVCVINLSQNKVVNQWSSPGIPLVDDFLENGTKQVCLMHNIGDVDNIMTRFTLVNMNGITIGSDQMLHKSSSSSQKCQSNNDSILSTIHALRTRLQASKSYLSELRIEYNNKRKMIDNTCKMLCKITAYPNRTINSNPPNRKVTASSSLVPLIGDQTSKESCQAANQDSQCLVEPPTQFDIHTTDVWQRVINNQWVIGVHLIHNKKWNDISDVSLSLIGCSNERARSSCCIMNDTHNRRLLAVKQNNDIMLEEPLAKKQKPDASIDYNVTLVTTMPEFFKEKHCTNMLVLTWTDCDAKQALSRQGMSCGHVTLDVNLLVNGNVSISTRTDGKQVNQDETALKTISMLTTLSLNQVPFNVIDVLNQNLGVDHIGDAATPGQLAEILHQSNDITGAQQGVGVLVDSKRRQLLLFTRNRNQIYINIRKLRHALPDDVLIGISESLELNAGQHGLARVQDQIDILKQHLKDTLMSTKHGLQVIELTIGDGGDSKVRNIRKAFETNRKRFDTQSRK